MSLEDISKLHDRINEEIKNRAELEKLVAVTAESVKHVTESVHKLIERDKDTHAIPCHMLANTKETLEAHIAAHTQTMKDWKAVAMTIIEKLIWAGVLFGAGAYANLITRGH